MKRVLHCVNSDICGLHLQGYLYCVSGLSRADGKKHCYGRQYLSLKIAKVTRYSAYQVANIRIGLNRHHLPSIIAVASLASYGLLLHIYQDMAKYSINIYILS